MNKTLIKIINGLKIFTDRQLSQKQMSNAVSKDAGISYMLCKEDGNSIDQVIKSDDGTYSRLQQSFELTTTSDVSHSRIQHTGYYPSVTIDSTYDAQGRLIEKHKSYGGLFNPASFFDKPVHRKYEPAGCWFGKKYDNKR